MAVVLTKTQSTQTKAEYINQVLAYAKANYLEDAVTVIEASIEDGHNQIYNIVANESDIPCVDYDFKNNQVKAVANWIDENANDILEALESAGNLAFEPCDGCDCGCCDCKVDSLDSVDTIKSLIGETLGLIQKELNAKSDVEKAEVVTGTNNLVNKMLKFFA